MRDKNAKPFANIAKVGHAFSCRTVVKVQDILIHKEYFKETSKILLTVTAVISLNQGINKSKAKQPRLFLI